MDQEIHYIKPNQEEYRIRRHKPIDEVRKVPLWTLIPLLLLTILGGYLCFSNLKCEETGQITYHAEGDIDYQVYLKENNYYTDKYLESGKQYIANLIDTVRAEFDYAFMADEPIDAHYEYEITAIAKATDRSDKTKVLYEQTDVLKTNQIQPLENGSFAIDDYVNIDYGKYNAIMRNFRSDFGILANCFLDLKLIVKVDGAIKTEDTLALNIPLSDQTVDISIEAAKLDREEKVGTSHNELYIKDMSLFAVGGAMAVISIIMGGIVIYLYKTRFGNNWYAEAEHKIFKNYDTHIVNVSENFYEPEDTVRVSSFIELLDASENEGAPIQHYDVDPGYKSYFVVKGANTTYRYTLSREYQDELRRSGQGKEF